MWSRVCTASWHHARYRHVWKCQLWPLLFPGFKQHCFHAPDTTFQSAMYSCARHNKLPQIFFSTVKGGGWDTTRKLVLFGPQATWFDKENI